MSGLAQYQKVFRISKPDTIKNNPKTSVSKRSRQSVSCLACRARKLKCDQQVPCQSCLKRGDVASCSYAPNNFPNGRRKLELPSRTSEAQIRLQKLEEMVSNLIQTSQNGDSELIRGRNANSMQVDCPVDERFGKLSVQSQSQNSVSGGHLDISGSEANYLGATHWATVLENIRDIQGVLNPESHTNDELSSDVDQLSLPDEVDIVLDTNGKIALTDVCNSLPSRNITDKLLSTYFNSRNNKLPIIHSGKFLREYQSFWADPTSVSFLWISVFFSLLHMGSRMYQAGDNSSENLRSSEFLMMAGKALVSGNYQKAKPYSVEALILYAVCRYMLEEDLDRDAWIIMGVGARLATKMGYHRDPRYLSNLSPFESEMRRRTFFIVEIFDLLLSFQAGLPPIIHEEERDTESPSNLFDTDFDEDCKVLPPSRPLSDYTPILYFSYKSGLAKMFRRVIRHALSLKATSYKETMELDAELRAKHAETPESLRTKPLSSSIIDPPSLILDRITTDMLFLKCLCVLHRNYISYERSNPLFAQSRLTCTSAALDILKYQAELHTAYQPGGLFSSARMKPSSLVLHDYLLAAMILSLDLYEARNDDTAMATQDELDVKTKKYDTVKRSYEILKERRDYSRDARRASDVLAVMLSKISMSSPVPVSAPPSISTVVNANVPQDIQDVPAAFGAQTAVDGEQASVGVADSAILNPSGDIDGFNTQAEALLVNEYFLSDSTFTDPLSSFYGESNDFNWGLVDQYLLDQNYRGEMF